MEQFTQAQWPTWGYATADPYSTYTPLPTYPAYLADSIEAAYQSHQHHILHNHQLSRSTESKPRLSKEEVEVLEAEFQKNHKPNSSTKKALAESMRVDNARINNWFQNRRAREKKENNIRAYEAKQRQEKESREPSTSHSDDDDEGKHNLATSSAPFPNPPKTLRQSPRELSSEAQSPTDDNETNSTQSPETSSNASPRPSASDEVSGSESSDDKLPASYTRQTAMPSQTSNGYLSVPGSTPDHAADLGADFESIVPLDDKSSHYMLNTTSFFLGQDDRSELSSSFASSTYGNNQDFLDVSLQLPTTNYGSNYAGSASLDASESPEMQLKSPPATDIASRRNRRPPPLSLGGRSFSTAAPKTANDLTAKRGDFGGSMRRVASANGTVRITKPSIATAQRSPFCSERMADGLLQLNSSPRFGDFSNAISPPTPNTPFVSTQQMSEDTLTLNTPFALDTKIAGSNVMCQDPTLRTPPTTPGIVDQLFNIQAAYEVSLSDEPLATPGLARFPGEFELPNLPTSVPGYITHGCISQPETPIYTPHVGPSYFGCAGGSTEYNWSDASNSTHSSPGQNSQPVQFMNMTVSNFSFAEEQ